MKSKLPLLLSMLILACVATFFTSCSDKDDEPKGDDLVEKLQGTWTIESCKVKVLGQTFEFSLKELRDFADVDMFVDEVLTFNGMYVNNERYDVKGNKILLPWYDEWEEITFSGSNKMTLHSIYDGEVECWLAYRKTSSRAPISGDTSGFNMVDTCLKLVETK